MSDFTINPDKLEGYPSFQDMNGFSPTQEKPFPKIMMNITSKNNRYPSISYMNTFSPTQEKPFPRLMLSCDNTLHEGYPSFFLLGNFSPTQEKPFPKLMLSCEEEYHNKYPSFRLGNFETFGAFKNTPMLQEVSIPKSVKRIADWTFYNSAIKEVTISKDCIYGEHTFPEGCIIKFY